MGVGVFACGLWADGVPSYPDARSVLSAGAQAEKNKDYRRAVRTYIDGLAQFPTSEKLRLSLDRAVHRLARQTETEQSREVDRLVRDARFRSDQRHVHQKELRDEVVRAQSLMDQGQLLEASIVLNDVLAQAPGLDEAQPVASRLIKRFSQRLKKPFDTLQHHGTYQGHYYYLKEQWGLAAGAFRAVVNAGPIPKELSVGRVQDYLVLAEKKWADEQWVKEREGLLAEAQRATKEGRLKDAKSNLQQVLAREPANPEAVTAMANLGAINTVVQKAVKEEEKQREVPGLLARGSRLMMDDRYADAIEVFHQVLELDPANVQAREQMSEAKRLLEGRGLYVPPVTVNSSAEDKYREGLQCYGAEQYDKARRAFEEALRLDPKHQEARLALQRLKEQK
jgi:tetratricopeptide (TPR) repeat protein